MGFAVGASDAAPGRGIAGFKPTTPEKSGPRPWRPISGWVALHAGACRASWSDASRARGADVTSDAQGLGCERPGPGARMSHCSRLLSGDVAREVGETGARCPGLSAVTFRAWAARCADMARDMSGCRAPISKLSGAMPSGMGRLAAATGVRGRWACGAKG